MCDGLSRKTDKLSLSFCPRDTGSRRAGSQDRGPGCDCTFTLILCRNRSVGAGETTVGGGRWPGLTLSASRDVGEPFISSFVS